MKITCLVVGARSDIFNGIRPLIEKDEWDIYDAEKVSSERPFITMPKWDLMLITMGRVAPVGNWWELSPMQFAQCIESNLTKPWEMLRLFWHWRGHNPTVLWFSGSNPQGIMAGYAPYNASKMAVNKLVEQLDYETPDAKFIAFGPGYVRDSKIHKATLDKGWPNPRIARGDAGNSMESIWNAMKWCIEQPKEVVGGRNVCVSDVPFHNAHESLFKLRRVQ